MRRPGKHAEDAREETAAHHVAALLRADAMQAVDEQRDQAGWHGLLLEAQRGDERRMPGPRVGRRWVALTVAVAALVVAGVSIFRASAPGALTFQIDGRDLPDAQLTSSADETRQLDFSDGSRLLLRPSGRVRVIETTARGAELILDRGELDLSVRHRASTRWRVSVGPYTVKVTGTRFKVTWNPDLGEIRVDTFEGSVTVEGPGVSAPVAIAGGQQFHATRSDGAGSGPRAAPPPEEPLAVTTSPAPGDAVAPRSNRVASPSRPLRTGACHWDNLVSRGQFDLILGQVRAMGIDRALAECPVGSLFSIADAARYRSDFDLSRRALSMIRRRSPSDAGKAAFFLGRVEEARGNYELALHWYSEAAEARQGPAFVSEARAAKARVSKRMPAQRSDAATPRSSPAFPGMGSVRRNQASSTQVDATP
jgi:transmembrane sensor